ncbi:MAG: hypothetical protein ACYDEO_21150 [Aggregatilineales bacterium]
MPTRNQMSDAYIQLAFSGFLEAVDAPNPAQAGKAGAHSVGRQDAVESPAPNLKSAEPEFIQLSVFRLLDSNPATGAIAPGFAENDVQSDVLVKAMEPEAH